MEDRACACRRCVNIFPRSRMRSSWSPHDVPNFPKEVMRWIGVLLLLPFSNHLVTQEMLFRNLLIDGIWMVMRAWIWTYKYLFMLGHDTFFTTKHQSYIFKRVQRWLPVLLWVSFPLMPRYPYHAFSKHQQHYPMKTPEQLISQIWMLRLRSQHSCVPSPPLILLESTRTTDDDLFLSTLAQKATAMWCMCFEQNSRTRRWRNLCALAVSI